MNVSSWSIRNPIPAILLFLLLTLAGLIPDDPSLCGISLYHQMLIPDPKAAGPYHLAMSNGLQRTLGS